METNPRGGREAHSRQSEQLLRNPGETLAGPKCWSGTELEVSRAEGTGFGMGLDMKGQGGGSINNDS